MHIDTEIDIEGSVPSHGKHVVPDDEAARIVGGGIADGKCSIGYGVVSHLVYGIMYHRGVGISGCCFPSYRYTRIRIDHQLWRG